MQIKNNLMNPWNSTGWLQESRQIISDYFTTIPSRGSNWFPGSHKQKLKLRIQHTQIRPGIGYTVA
jgi:hypothetical protein